MEQNKFTPEDIAKNKDMAALGYLWLFSIVILLSRRDSAYAQLHAAQGTVLFVLSLLLWPVAILRYGEFIVLALMVLGFIQAVSGNPYRIPVISVIAGGDIRLSHFKKAWHIIKHTTIKIFKPEHITPAFREELNKQQTELKAQEKMLGTEEDFTAQEEKKLSSLLYRVDEDEKEIHKLEDEVHKEFEKLENDLERIERKVDEAVGARNSKL
jgi:uncharacterized membrane protein